MDNTEETKPIVTEEIAAKYRGRAKGRIPEAIKDQVVKINHAKKHPPELEKLKLMKKTEKGIQQTARLDAFLEEFMKNGGNATQAATKVFNCSTYESAASLGYKYLAKAKNLGRLYLEKQGYSYGKLLTVAAQKMEESKTPEWWDRIMKISEYADFMTKDKTGPTIVTNVMAAHKNLTSEYIEGEEAEVIEEDDDED